ncbi:MAG: AAA family ATPase [Cytophagales bacterium]|nr:AAA family ATPase [Armatimonadota bacterium]
MAITKRKNPGASDRSEGTAPDGLLTPEQRHGLLEARAWWQEGDRALDYLAERARLQSRVGQIAALLAVLEREPVWAGSAISPLLPLLRGLSANRAINRTLATDSFAQGLRELLFGEDVLSARLTLFLRTQRVGQQTTSQFLYGASPERYPLVSPATRTLLAPSPAQRIQARQAARRMYGEEAVDSVPTRIRALLADFSLYEAARDTLGVESFVDVNAILWHAREMPPGRGRTSRAPATFATAANVAAAVTPSPASPTEVREGVAWYGTEPFGDGEEDLPARRTTETELLDYLEGFVASQGFTFPALAVRDYYIALKTKPFVILSGLSGTGKTRLTELLAEAITGNLSGQYLLLPVRPDWTDGTALLGYQNLLTDRYVSTPFLEKLVAAAQPENRERAFFLVLDEMNLARVEYYLADILSAMETRTRAIPLTGATPGRTVALPSNVFLTGSVNVDETTHPLSKKVLDRANTIEFTEVTLRAPFPTRPVSLPEIPAWERQRLFLASRVTEVRAAAARLETLDPSFPNRVQETLATLNELLQPRGLHFGYRVRDEALRYVANSFAADPDGGGLLIPQSRAANLAAALDLQVLQKALPRISGTEEALRSLLAEMESWAAAAALPRSRDKIAAMRRRAAEDGFVTFHES